MGYLGPTPHKIIGGPRPPWPPPPRLLRLCRISVKHGGLYGYTVIIAITVIITNSVIIANSVIIMNSR